MAVQQMPPVAPFPLVLGVFRRLTACCRHRHRCSYGLGEGTPRAPAAPLAVAHGPLWHRRRHAPHTPRPSRTARAVGAPPASGSRVVGEVAVLRHPAEDNGWTGRATTGPPAGGTDAALLQASQDQKTPGAPGGRWRQPPAASAPVWLAQPARLAAWALRPVVGLRVSRMRQRQGRVSLRPHAQQRRGHQGLTAPPTAAVGVAVGAHVARLPCALEVQQSEPLSGGQPQPRLLGDALARHPSWYEAPSAHTNGRGIQTP
jgi:hypothetical protein